MFNNRIKNWRGTLARWRYKRMKAALLIMTRYRRYKLRSFIVTLVNTFKFVFFLDIYRRFRILSSIPVSCVEVTKWFSNCLE